MLRSLIITAVLIAGCAGEQLTPEEREYKAVEKFADWELCMRILRRSGAITIHRDHTGSGRGSERAHEPGNWEIRDDLLVNGCYRILRQYEENWTPR